MPREVSVTTTSKTAAYLDEELKHCQTMSTSNDFPFLFLDRITWKVREISVEREVMLCALGLKGDGAKETLSFREECGHQAVQCLEGERAVRCMENDLYHCLHYYSFPEERKALRESSME